MMKIDSISFDFTNRKLIVAFENGTTKEYDQSTKDQYIADFPDRSADIVAIGW
jgi:hypothetical protein